MIYADDVEQYGGVILWLFKNAYPDGATMEQLEADAPNHGWIRNLLVLVRG